MRSCAVTFVEPDGIERRISVPASGQTLMEIARNAGIAGITADCGGGCSCATCHVVVDPRWLAKVGEPDDIEDGMLDMVSEVRQPNSRLSCQIPFTPELDGIRVTVVATS